MPARASDVLPDVGALVEGPASYAGMSGRANLALLDSMGPAGARSSRARRVDDALDEVGLGGVDGRPVRAYSLGMRQRLGLAAALLRTPRLLVLDEPTNGLDPQGIREIRDLLLRLNAAGTTIFLSSHLLAEVEQMCGRVGVIDRGHLVLQERLDVLRRPTGRLQVRTPDVARARGAARRPGRVLRRPGAADPVRRRRCAQRPAGRRGRAGRDARPRAPHPGGRRPRGDRVGLGPGGAVMIAVELRKMLRSRRTWVTIADHRPAAVAGRGPARGHRPRPAARAPARRSSRPCSPTARSTRSPRSRSSCRSSCRSPSRSPPARRSPARPSRGRCATS